MQLNKVTFRTCPHPPPQPHTAIATCWPLRHHSPFFSSKHHTIDPHLLNIHPSYRARQKRHLGDTEDSPAPLQITPTWCDWQLLRLTISGNWAYANPVQRI